jgi:acyl-CoA thioesterase-2
MTSAVDTMIAVLDLEPLEENLFRGSSPQDGWQRVFGGQVIGQALVAATRTVDGWPAHSLHGYFMRPGDPAVPIIYQVERYRDGRSFVTRRVIAVQHGQPIFSMAASFHAPEEGYDHQFPMPDVAAPEDLPSEKELVARLADRLPENVRRYWERDRPIEMRPVAPRSYTEPVKAPPFQNIWIRASARLSDSTALHQCVLAYASDFTLLDTSLIAHGRSFFDKDIQMASLDHALWFHRPFRADEWLLYSQDSPSASNALGFTRGSIFTRDGRLVSSVAQEGLIRQRTR